MNECYEIYLEKMAKPPDNTMESHACAEVLSLRRQLAERDAEIERLRRDMCGMGPLKPDDIISITVEVFEKDYVSRRAYDELKQRLAALEAAINKIREIKNETNKFHAGIEDYAAIFGDALDQIAEVVNGVVPLPPADEEEK